MDTFLNDPFFRDTEAITSSFLDSMIPKDTVSNMNQFDFLVDIVEKKDKFHLSGELRRLRFERNSRVRTRTTARRIRARCRNRFSMQTGTRTSQSV